jgi:glycine hydroxymethyltransferase
MREIADKVGARLMMDMAHVAGLVAAKLHPDPIPYCDVVTSTTHKTLRGPRGGLILCRAELAKEIDRAVFPGTQGGPLMHVIASKAVAFGEALRPEFVAYQRRVLENAQVLARTLQEEGLRIVSGGTDNHLMLVDLSVLGTDAHGNEITGKLVEKALDRAGIHCNKNMIPFDKKPALTTSGIRLGTPAATTRGLGPEEFVQIGRWIARIAKDPTNESLQRAIRDEVIAMTAAFPVPA